MKKLFFIAAIVTSTVVFSQDSEYSLSSYLTKGTKAPNTHYIGEAWLYPIIHNNQSFEYNITKATFKANATLDWHTHSSPQVLIIISGKAYYQEKGKEPLMLQEGDVIQCEQGIEHWHSSSKYSDVTYLAIYKGGQPTTWTEVLTQAYYDKVSKTLEPN